MKIDLDQVRELLAVVSQTDITELSIESGDQKITIKKPVAGQVAVATTHVVAGANPLTNMPALTTTAVKEPETANGANNGSNGWVAINSPMVGTFYRSPSPTASPFVDIGDVISVGQTICIIEAMKLMNDLPAEISGRIVKICAENGTTVEYGQPLFMIDPNG